MIATVFGLETPTTGLSRLLFGRTTVDEVLVPAPAYEDNLRLVLAGSERPIDLLEPRRIEAVLSQLEATADVIIVDSPPVTEFADALVWAKAVDTVLVAVRVGYSRRDKVDDVRRFLSQAGIAPAGYVVTSHQRSRGRGGTPPIYDEHGSATSASPELWVPDAPADRVAVSDGQTRVG
jgi:tyrosine-protein kinase Etk/Wzc